jgi:hypothetical protein
MGYYAGIVPLRGQIDRSRVAVRSFTSSDINQTIDSFANAIPFVELVRALGEQSEAGYNPLFECRFALQNHPMPEVTMPKSFRASEHALDGDRAFPARCEITEAATGLEVAWLFREEFVFPDVTLKISMAYFSEFWRASAARREAESLK